MASGVGKRPHFGLTKRQKDFLGYVQAYVDECGLPPTYSEIASALKLSSKSGVHRLAQGLSRRGHLRIKKGLARSIVLTTPPPDPIEVAMAAKLRRLPEALTCPPLTVHMPARLHETLHRLAKRAQRAPESILVEALEDYILEQPE